MEEVITCEAIDIGRYPYKEKTAILEQLIRDQFPLLHSARNAKLVIVDPENSYTPEMQALRGVIMDIFAESEKPFNPLDFVHISNGNDAFSDVKPEYAFSLCKQIITASESRTIKT